MGDDTNPWPDPIWNAAWAWVLRQHETPDLDESAKAELIQWLAADPQHRLVYEKACKLWLLVGLVPPVHDMDDPDPEPDRGNL